ncbi:MAG: beta-lactamase [Microbacteriaceae bacterium]|nr:beta-lactamase [Microbacteriaceae bacterium]
MSEVVLRTAQPDDLHAVVGIFLECWRVSYAAVLPAGVLDRMDDASARDLWRSALARPGTTLLAARDGRPLGLVRFTRDGTTGHIASLYVSPASQGEGLGRRLLAAAESELMLDGAEHATLWVFRDNAPSIAFYARNGWEPTGAERVEEEFGAPEIGLGKTLVARRRTGA